jgi:anti-sigma factor ChrR (cupin superfamily)
MDVVHWHRAFNWTEAGPGVLASGAEAHLYRIGPDDADESAPLVVNMTFPPGWSTPAHTHTDDYTEIILSGEMTVGRTTYGPGDVRVAHGGTGYGPLAAGPDGCNAILIFKSGDGLAKPLRASESA